MRAFRADWVCPVSGPPIRDGVVVVEDGRIREVGERTPPGARVEAHPRAALLPGFVNVHTHLELTVLRGFLENLPFPRWIRQLMRAKYEVLSPADLALSARLGAYEALSAGITAVGEVMDVGRGWDAMIESGLRGVAYQEVFGPQPDVAAEAATALEAKLEPRLADQTSFRRLGVSPHAPYTVSDALYGRVATLAARRGWPVAFHIAESDDEAAFVRDGRGPFAEQWRRRGLAVAPRALGPVAHLDRLGVLDARTLAIHAIHCAPDEIRRMAARGVAVAHCPKSNLKLGHGIAPVMEFMAAGVRVGLGTDSVASNNAMDMFEEMRAAIHLQRTRARSATVLDAAAALRLATLDGARCLGLEHEIGSLEPGKLADLIVVDLEDCGVRPVYDPVGALVHGANRRSIRRTILGGEYWRPPDPGTLLDPADRIAARLAAAFAGGSEVG